MVDLIDVLCELWGWGELVDGNFVFFYFGMGFVVCNICREWFSDKVLGIYGLLCIWDDCYVVVFDVVGDCLIGKVK